MNGSFRERYLLVADDLLTQLPGDCGTPEEEIVAGETRLGVKLPFSLREYFLAIGKLKLNKAHNRLLIPAKWFINSEKLVFIEENQRVVYWGVDATTTPAADPPLFQGVNGLPKWVEWHFEQNAVSDFLVLTLHFQAAMGGFERVVSANVEPGKLRYFESGWQFGGESNGLIAFRRRGEVACFMGSRGDASLQMFAGCVSEAGYPQLSSTLEQLGIGFDEL